MNISSAEKIKLIMARQKITMTQLAERSGQSRQNLSNKFSRNNLSEDDIEKLASAMGCTVEIKFILPDGTEI